MSKDLLSRSRYALLTGDLGQAESLCMKLLKKEPDNTSGQLLLGSIFVREGKLQSAQKVFETMLQKDPENVDTLIDSALVYQKRGKLKTALNTAQKAYRLAGDRADIIYNIGNIHRQLGELSRAEQIYRLAIEKKPDFIPTYNNLALLLSEAGKNKEAEKILTQGLSIDENNPGLHFNLANIYRKRGEDKKAEQEYRTALKINPGWEDCLLNLGDLLQKKDPDEASRLYRKVLDLSPGSPEAKCRTGEIAFDLGDTDKAEIIFSELLTDNPFYTPAAVNLSAVYYSLKNLPAAEKLLREHQENDPDNMELRLLLGNILLETGKYNEAFSIIRYILDRNQNESRAWFAMARQFSLSGKKDRALNTYRKGLNIDPDAHDARLQLALLLKSLNKTDGAITECEYIYKNSPEDFAPALLLAELYIENKNFRKAATILEKLSAADPDDIKLLQMFAETAKEAGLTEKALQAAEKLAASGNDDQTDFDLEELNENLKFFDEMAIQYAREYGSSWNRNLKALARTMEPIQQHEEASFMLDGLQDIAGEYVPILDVGGIDPVILFDEEEEELTITDEDEFIPPPEEDEEPEPEEIEKIEEIESLPAPAAPSGAPAADASKPAPPPQPAMPLNFNSPLTIKLETPPIVIQKAPPPPEPEPDIDEEQEIVNVEPREEPVEEENNIFGYLDNLTKYLPSDKLDEYRSSDMRLKLAALKAKMAGDPGLIARIQSSREETASNKTDVQKVKLTNNRIGNTLNFMTGLTRALPDSRIADSLSDRLKNILKKIDDYKKEEPDDKND